MGNSVGNCAEVGGRRKRNSSGRVVHEGEERVILRGSVGWIAKGQGGTKVLVGVEDAQ